MRINYIILFFIVFVYSCKPSKVGIAKDIAGANEKFIFLYSEALKNEMLGQSKLAKAQFIECLSLNPSSTASAYQLAQILIGEGDYLGAKVYSDFCVNKVANNEWYFLQRAEIARKLNEIEIYSKIYARLVQLHPDNLDYVYEHAVIQYTDKQYDEALESLKKIEEEIGVNENISFLRNNIFFSIKRIDAIQLELLKLRNVYPDSIKYSDMLAEFYLNSKQNDKALNVYKSILNTEPDNGYANLGIAFIYGNSDHQNLGYRYLLKGIQNDSIAFTRKEKVADLYLNSNNGLLNEDSLKVVYTNLINHSENDISIFNKYLKFLFDRKEIDLVEKYSRVSIAKTPENITAWEYLLNSLMLEGKNEELKTLSAKALEYFPNHAIIFFYNGYSNFALTLYNEAISYFDIGIDFVSENIELEKQFLFYLAESYHKVSKYKQSDSYFDKYLKLDSTNAFVLNNYAFYLVQRNLNLAKALNLSKKSIEIEPFNSSFLDTYAWILFSLNDYDKSIGFIERAYKYGGNLNAVIVEHYGDILFEKNKIDEALERWKEAYALNRSNAKLLEKINKIELEN